MSCKMTPIDEANKLQNYKPLYFLNVRKVFKINFNAFAHASVVNDARPVTIGRGI